MPLSTTGAHALVVPLSPVPQPYTYAVPDALDALAVPGARVLVPFGRRTLTGVVVGRTDEVAEGVKLKPIADVLDVEAPALPPALLRLTEWMANYYACSWGEVLRAALPAGTDVEGVRVLYRTDAPAAWRGNPLGRDLLVLLGQRNGNGLPLKEAEEELGVKLPTTLLADLRTAGLLRIAEETTDPRVRAKTARWLRIRTGIDPSAAPDELRGLRQQMLVATLAASTDRALSQADALAASGASSQTVQRLVELGWVEAYDVEVERRPEALDAAAPTPQRIALHPAQRAALDQVNAALVAQHNGTKKTETFLLHGVTGSGKTEVYLRALKATLDAGRTGIVLVPEIALTPQTVRRFRAHFGDDVAVLHSRMSPGERYDAWRHLRAGRYRVAIGPRSAVLAPLENVGLIVVDEEHEASYKQFDPAPRYHARDVAVMRAHLAGAVCVLGSATPSAESFVNAKRGKYTLLPMPERVPVSGRTAARLPEVKVVDLAREQEVRRLRGALSVQLQEAIQARLDRKEQTILLQNRRGYAPILTCNACGHTPECPSCAVTLTLHRPPGLRPQLRCHYCGFTRAAPSACDNCGQHDLADLGAGTQRVEEELAATFPEARVLRMDLDTTSKKDAHRKLLTAFGRGEADILLGTQMVAKGLDFPRVTLVGVVNADTGMLLPDFRAAERTFQLLAQVGGRAGRAERPGEVFLQTRNPDHPAIRFALAHDYDGFIRADLPDRRFLGYPPFGRLVGIEFKGPNEATVEKLAARWTTQLTKRLPRLLKGLSEHDAQHLQVLGPTAAFIGRVKKQYRFHTILKAPLAVSPYALTTAVAEADAAAGSPPKGCRVNIDVDPVGLY
ncbi:MAG: primosomal protein N' [Bacteroidota bacterium]